VLVRVAEQLAAKPDTEVSKIWQSPARRPSKSNIGRSSDETVVAAGAPLLVDVEFGRGRTLLAIAQGIWDGPFEGTPALPNTGALVQVDGNGTFTVLAEGLDRPTSLEIIKNTAYVVTIGGEIWTIDNFAGPPFGRTAVSNPTAKGNR
jgi:hypothetical protein